MSNRYIIGTLISILLVSGCKSTPKTELEQYKELTNSFNYKGIKVISGNTVDPSLKLYNKMKSDDKFDINPAHIHALASVSFALLGEPEPEWALAEADLALESSKTNEDKKISYSALSLALHNEGLEKLGDDYAFKANNLTSQESKEAKQEEKMIISSILGISAITRGDGKAAELLFSEISENKNIEWLPIAAHGAAIIIDSPSPLTIPKLTELSQREGLSLAARAKLAELRVLASKYENEPEKMKSETSKIAQKWTLDALKYTGKATVNATMEVLPKIFAKLYLVAGAR